MTMNTKYPYPVSNPQLIPESVEAAKCAIRRLKVLCDSPQRADLETFLRGWFAIQFVSAAPHPDDVDDWPEDLLPIVHEARRRLERGEIDENQYYCSSSQHEGQRLQIDRSLCCYVVGLVGGETGYLSGVGDPVSRYRPVLTCKRSNAHYFDSPVRAWLASSCLPLSDVKIYAGSPDHDLDCPVEVSVPLNASADPLVVIMIPDGRFLYRDGKTFGGDPVKACKYRLHSDGVIKQLRQVEEQVNVVWRWVPYPLPG